MQSPRRYLCIIHTPLPHASAVREAVAEAGAGRIGNYAHCSLSSRGTGRFLPLKGAKPVIGSVGFVEEVEEERLEVIVEEQYLSSVIAAARKAHPYEEPAMHVVKIEDMKSFLKDRKARK